MRVGKAPVWRFVPNLKDSPRSRLYVHTTTQDTVFRAFSHLELGSVRHFSLCFFLFQQRLLVLSKLRSHCIARVYHLRIYT